MSDPPRRAVGEMFGRIAPTYDLLNHIWSFGQDWLWRRKAVGYLADLAAPEVLDLATGTGDMLIALLRRCPSAARAVGVDVSARMLELCEAKITKRGLRERVRLAQGDAAATGLAEASFDAVTMGFGIRNMDDALGTLAEMCRVLRPGGKAVVLEFALPENQIVRRMYLAYLRFIVPLIGGIVSGDKDAYRYLDRTIEGFHDAKSFCPLMERAGFVAVKVRRLALGVACIYIGSKPTAGV